MLYALVIACTSCDPLIDVAGAFFPAWILCIAVAIAATALLRVVFARTGLERSLGPLVVVYPGLATAIALACWVIFFRR
ncbi:MAG TPA: YtcA family lipoprotein [Stellaceae bacterium]|nr:YtcA family lipoprotein [Stellaceae bacterium]